MMPPLMKARSPTRKPPRRSAPPEPRARLGLDERRAQLLRLGRELFSERAYDDIAIDDIAAAAGISKGLLYHYFGSKRGFYVATVEEAASEMLAATTLDPALPPPEKARRSMEAYLDFVEQHASAYVALLRGGIGTDPEVATIVDRTRNEFVQRFVSNLGLKEPRPVFQLAARSWIGLVEAASLSYLEQRALARGGVDRETVMTFLLETLYQILVTAMRLDPEAPLVLALPPEPALKRS
jgi:AcrR family transcriptional regulator